MKLTNSNTCCTTEIYVPSVLERYSVTFIVLGVLTGFFGTISYFSVRRRIALRSISLMWGGKKVV